MGDVMSISDASVAWEDLPLKHCEDSKEWNDLMARYSHIGCPGVQYDDNCVEPWDCASKGRCRLTYLQWQEMVNNLRTAP